MDATVLVVFALVYLAMLLGGVPGLALDRAGAALLGAIVLVATETIPPEHAWHAVDVPILALASTLAGNLFLIGSIANLIVAEQAAPLGVVVGWRAHARVGVPVTLLTLGIAALWLALRAFW